MTGTGDRGPSLYRIMADLFRGRERWLLFVVFGVSIVAALFETLGVASILPFMMLVLDPSALDRYAIIGTTLRAVGVTTTQGALLLIGIGTVFVVAFGSLAAAVNVYVQQRFVARTETRFCWSLFSGYLRQPYSFHVQRDAPSLMKVLDSDSAGVINGVIVPVALLVSRAAAAIAILLLLVWRDPVVTVAVAVVLVAAYWFVFLMVRTTQQALGTATSEATEARARITQEGLGGIKELQVLGRVQLPMERYLAAVSRVSRNRARNQMVAQLPRNIMETVAFGGILIVALVKVAVASGNTQTVIPILALYAFAGYRLLPACQQVFVSAVSIKFSRTALVSLYADFSRVVLNDAANGRAEPEEAVVRFRHELRLEGVSFTYRGAPTAAVRNVSLTIRPNESVGFVGRTGAGKTTLADIILGLYEPSAGCVTVDGVALTGPAIRGWRRSVGYVPQSIFLSNASISENIAFGVPPAAIDPAAVQRAAGMAQAEEFILSLPHGFDTLVGERGVKLSGGQRQRIGIARALYHQPDVLVLDEATSALDGLTEDAVMDAIRSLAHERTVILIAHRLRTVEACDRIVMFDQGRVVADGSYDGLLETSEPFRQMVGRPRAFRLDLPASGRS